MRFYVVPTCATSIGYFFETPVLAWWEQLQQSIWETMRDQINGQLYDAWRCDCDDPETKRFLGGVACRVSDDYTHSIIPASDDAAYERYEDKLAD